MTTTEQIKHARIQAITQAERLKMFVMRMEREALKSPEKAAACLSEIMTVRMTLEKVGK